MIAKNRKRDLENRQVIYLPLWQSTAKAGQAHIPWLGKGPPYLIKAFTYTSIYQASLKEVNGSKRSINQFTHHKHMPPWKKGKTQSRFQDCTLFASMAKHSGGLQFKNYTKSLSRTNRSSTKRLSCTMWIWEARDKNNFCCLHNWAKWSFVLWIIPWHKRLFLLYIESA